MNLQEAILITHRQGIIGMQVLNKKNMKKLLIISAIILTLFIIALGAYYFILKTNEKSLNGNKISVTDFFPFGENNNKPIITETETGDDFLNEDLSFKNRFRLISKEPVAGATFIEKNNEKFIRYINKGNGHIYDTSISSDQENKISNTTILNIQKVYFTNKGDSFVAQYLKEDDIIENNFINIISNGSTTEKELQVKILDPNIENLSVGQNNGNIFYFIRKGLNSFGFISKSPKYENSQIWTDKLKQLIPEFVTDNLFILTTKPESNSFGYSYKLSTKGDLELVLGQIYGLTVKADSIGDYLVFNSTQPSFAMYLYDIKNKTSKTLSPETFPEKCIFGLKDKKTLYCAVPETDLTPESLNDWYFGRVGYSDSIWKYDLKNNTSEKLADLNDLSGFVIDIDQIIIDKEDTTLILKNKADGGSLWSFKINP